MAHSAKDTPTFVSLDYGTQSVRALLINAKGGVLDQAQLPTPRPIEASDPSAGLCEYRPEDCYQTLVSAIRQLVNQQHSGLNQLKGMALTTQRNCCLFLDAENRPLTPLVHWSDQRMAHRLKPMAWYYRLGFALVRVSKRIAFLRQRALVNWLAEHQPQTLNNTAKLEQLSGYLHWRMTAKWQDSEASQVGYLPFNFRQRRWYTTRNWRFQALAIKPQWLPTLISPTSPVGPLTPEFAREAGLAEGLMLYAAGADKACESYATGGGDAGVLNLSLGSAATLSLERKGYREALRYLPAFCSIDPNQHIVEIQLERGMWLFRYFIDQFGQQDCQRASELGVSVETYILERLAKMPPGADGLRLNPTWAPGIVFPGPNASGSVHGWRVNHTRWHLYQAALEGIAFTLKRQSSSVLKCKTDSIQRLRVSGGGSQNQFVVQMLANVFNLPAEVIQTHQSSALGAAMCVAVGSGVYPDLSSARSRMTQVLLRLEPNPAAVVQYQQVFQLWSSSEWQKSPF
ncbi:FGGY-family carbohydrate kinase [Paraferrimonas sedimenticola]|uniref:Carbohydrate kinase n=1 Tax=Paraferrimonas sedimenticola TaxID=375674 RepID=A0AA37W0T3_9GAMM|nr:FGGY-family carbohydrate kinase [Paraferrimonas sedimenticola]GLP96490.1 carbohydrate kinase [Paraferrimonas sedimenticola]